MIKELSLDISRIISTAIFLILQVILLSGQQLISTIRNLPLGSVVTTKGIITTGDEFGQIRFMQDGSAGISLYSDLLSETIPGDSILITGVISTYRGQIQISPVNSFQIIASSRPLPEPKLIYNLDEPYAAYESMRVKMYCIGVASCEPYYDSEWYTIFNQGGKASKMVMAQQGMPVSDRGAVVTGLWVNVENSFQLWCETLEIDTFCRIFQPAQVSFNLQNVGLTWNNNYGHGAWVEYGIDDFDQIIHPQFNEQEISVSFNNLIPGQIYQARLCQMTALDDIIYSLPTYFSAVSMPSVPIEIFFDRTVDNTFSDGSHPTGTGSPAIENDIISKLDQVISTLDIAMYNTTRQTIVQAIVRAAQRGVTVRYIADDETQNSALLGIVSFSILYRQGDGIMHNKFMIADADDPDRGWVWTGSTNFSPTQLSSDPNNALVIHDQGMALNYKKEFDELWGSTPNHSDGKEGDLKSDNTAHQFKIGNTIIESYFSPSDETNCHILDALSTADHQIQIGLLLLTYEGLVDELISLHNEGIDIRVIIDDEESSSIAISRLRQAGIEVAIHDLSPIFHHKYAIVDEGYPDSDPFVITGSHNWTFSADNLNDENTLIIHDQSIANIYRQEFEARWKELVSSGTILINNSSGLNLQPNPASEIITFTNPTEGKCTVTLIDVNGKIVGKQNLSSHQTIDFPIDHGLPNGIYLVHWSWTSIHAVAKLIIQR